MSFPSGPKLLRMGLLISTAVVAGCGGGSARAVPAVSDATSSVIAQKKAPASMHAAVAASAYTSVVLGDLPQVYYQLNDATSTAVDSGPQGLSGLYGSGVSQQLKALTTGGGSAAGFPGGAYSPNTYVSTPQNVAMQPATVSVEAWIETNQ